MTIKCYKDKDCRVYVMNLQWKTSWQELKDLFKTNGFEPKRADIFRDGKGTSRGCGIVVLASKDEATKAVQKVNGQSLRERKVFVREDRHEDFKPRWDPRDRNSPARKSRNGTRQLRQRKHAAAAVELPEQPQQ